MLQAVQRLPGSKLFHYTFAFLKPFFGWLRSRPITSSFCATLSLVLLVTAINSPYSEAIIQTGSRLGLESYSLKGSPMVLAGVENNASGLTYNPDTNTLFAIIDFPEAILEISLAGDVLRSITMAGFRDTEGLTYLGEGRFALIEEGRRSIVFIDSLEGIEVLERGMLPSIAVPFAFNKRNRGFEGITVNHQTGSLYIVNEKLPRRLMKVDGLLDPAQLGINFSTPWDMESRSLGKKDLSGLHFEQSTNHLLILSDESRRLTEVDIEGNSYGVLEFGRGDAGLKERIEQPEGVTVDAKGDIYIIGEPNILYRFSREVGQQPDA